jgi:hypothetical protein
MVFYPHLAVAGWLMRLVWHGQVVDVSLGARISDRTTATVGLDRASVLVGSVSSVNAITMRATAPRLPNITLAPSYEPVLEDLFARCR